MRAVCDDPKVANPPAPAIAYLISEDPVNMSRYHPELTVRSFWSAVETAATVMVSEPMVAVALAEITKTVPEVMEITVAPVGMPEPYTIDPGRMPVVSETVTLGLPDAIEEARKAVAVPTVSMLAMEVTPVRGAVLPSRKVSQRSIRRLCPSRWTGKERKRLCQKVALT